MRPRWDWPRLKLRGRLFVALGAVLVLVVAFVALFDSGWAFGLQQSESVRTGSFKPYAGMHIGEDEAGTFLVSRVAVLLGTDEIHPKGLTFNPPNSQACAVAIDHRGYFLTAGHCTSRKTIYLLLYEPPNKVTVLPARVVWRGDGSKGQPDLAILRVPAPLDFTFNVADDVHRDEPVMAVGLAFINSLTNAVILAGPQMLELMGGHVQDCTSVAGAATDLRVATDVPLQPGDSGGALVDTHGRLVGINTLIRRVLWSRTGVAFRPNEKWLSDIIEHDAATHAHSDDRP